MKRTVVFLCALCMVSVSCKQTVESQKKAWDRNLKSIEALAAEYPSYKTVLDAQKKSAEVIMKDSEKITEEKAKIAKMGQANDALKVQFIRNLSGITDAKRSIRKKTVDVRGLDITLAERLSVNRAISDADLTMEKTEAKLRDVPVSVTVAEAVTALVLRDLNDSRKILDGFISRAKEKARLAKKAESDKKNAAEKNASIEKGSAGGTTATQPAVKTVKCQYCGTVNPIDLTNCRSCGAPLKK